MMSVTWSGVWCMFCRQKNIFTFNFLFILSRFLFLFPKETFFKKPKFGKYVKFQTELFGDEQRPQNGAIEVRFDFDTTPVNKHMLKINDRNTKTRCEICSKLTIKTLKYVIEVVLVPLLLTLEIFHTFF